METNHRSIRINRNLGLDVQAFADDMVLFAGLEEGLQGLSIPTSRSIKVV